MTRHLPFLTSRLRLSGILSTVICGLLVTPGAEAQSLSPNFGGVRDLPSDYFGINQNTVQYPAWRQNPEGAALVDDLNFGAVRYPGGTVSSYFRWWTGTVAPGSPNPPAYDYWLDDLKHVHDQTGATPIFVMNMINGGGKDQQIQQLTAAANKGIPIKRVELGNEYYLDNSHWVSKFNNGQGYGATAKVWAQDIRALFPDVEIAAIGAVNLANTDPNSRIGKWNNEIWQQLSPGDVDAVTLHYYSGSGLFGGKVNAPAKWGTTQQQADQYNKLLASNGPDVFIGHAFSYLDAVEQNTYVPDGVDIWVTENNLFDRNGAVRHTWSHGMYTAAMQMQMLQDTQITQSTFHNLMNQSQMFGLAYAGDRPDKLADFEGLDPSLNVNQSYNPQTYTPQEFDLTASGHVMKFIGNALDGADRVQKLWFSQSNLVTGDGVFTHPAVMAVRIFDDDTGEHRVLIVNLSDETVVFDTSLWAFGNSTRDVLTANPRHFITHPDLVTQITDATVYNNTNLPAYSLVLITDPPQGIAVPEPVGTAAMLGLMLLGISRRPRVRARVSMASSNVTAG